MFSLLSFFLFISWKIGNKLIKPWLFHWIKSILLVVNFLWKILIIFIVFSRVFFQHFLKFMTCFLFFTVRRIWNLQFYYEKSLEKSFTNKMVKQFSNFKKINSFFLKYFFCHVFEPFIFLIYHLKNQKLTN